MVLNKPRARTCRASILKVYVTRQTVTHYIFQHFPKLLHFLPPMISGAPLCNLGLTVKQVMRHPPIMLNPMTSYNSQNNLGNQSCTGHAMEAVLLNP